MFETEKVNLLDRVFPVDTEEENRAENILRRRRTVAKYVLAGAAASLATYELWQHFRPSPGLPTEEDETSY